MFEINDIREWRDHDVIDESRSKIGQLESIYVDTATDQPAFATVTIGMPTRRRLAFVPLAGATVGPGYIQVRYPKKLVREAPCIDTDGELMATAEPELFGHYNISYTPGSAGERRLARR
jgi:hypothetical protein